MIKIDAIPNFGWKIKRLDFHMEKLIFLAESYKKLPIRTIGNEIILETILVEIRAIYLENARYKNNYTIPNFLKEIKQESFYQKIQDYLDKP